MKFIVAALLLLLSVSAQAQTLSDKYLLSNEPAFTSRVRASIIAAAVAISNEGSGVTNHTSRDAIAVNVLTSPDAWKSYFSAAVAVDTTVASQATTTGTVALTTSNVAAQGALVTDVAINNAVSAAWNSFFAH